MNGPSQWQLVCKSKPLTELLNTSPFLELDRYYYKIMGWRRYTPCWTKNFKYIWNHHWKTAHKSPGCIAFLHYCEKPMHFLAIRGWPRFQMHSNKTSCILLQGLCSGACSPFSCCLLAYVHSAEAYLKRFQAWSRDVSSDYDTGIWGLFESDWIITLKVQ